MIDIVAGLLAQGQQAASQDWLKAWVTEWKIHPVLVNFTAALVPVSIFSDWVARLFRNQSLRATGFWTMLFAGIITPFTAIAGWLFWMRDDNGDPGMTIHKWLGTGLAIVLLGMLAWRVSPRARERGPNWLYLIIGLLIVAALIYQGVLGGDKVFSG